MKPLFYFNIPALFTRCTTTNPMFVAVLAVMAFGLVLGTGAAFAQEPPDMEIDGDAVDNPANPRMDWDSVLGYNGFPGAGGDTLNTGIIDDSLEPDPSTFTQGSKDFEPITDWVCTTGQVKDKNNIQNSAVALFPQSNILYFMSDRLAVEGDAQIGFWLLQDTVSCQADGGTHNFVGEYKIGDVLVQIDFVSGGSFGDIVAFRYVGTGGNFTAEFDSLILTGFEANAVVNQSVIQAPWGVKQKNFDGPCAFGTDMCYGINISPQGNVAGAFFEGFLDLGSVLPDTVCFSKVLFETRSSQSKTSARDDWNLGGFETAPSCSLTAVSICETDIQAYPYEVQVPAIVNVPLGTATLTWGTTGNCSIKSGFENSNPTTVIINGPGVCTVNLQVAVGSTAGCISNCQTTITVYDAPEVTVGDFSTCETAAVAVSATLGGGATGGTWTTSGSGSFANANATSTNYTPSAADVTAGTVTLTFTTNANGDCPPDQDDGTLTVYDNPVVNVGDFSTCENAAVAVTATGDVTGGSWSTSGTGSFANANAASTNYTPSAADVTAGTVTLTFTSAANGDCPADSDDGTLTIYDAPMVTVGDFSTCENAAVAVTATGDVTGGSWSTSGTGSFANANAASTNYTPSAADVTAGTVTLTFTSAANGDCPADSDDGTLTIYDNPVVNVGDFSTCQTAAVAVTATGDVTGGSWSTSGTGSFANANAASTNYTPSAADVTAGTVTLTFTSAANGDCPPDSDDGTLTIYDQPQVNVGNFSTCETAAVAVTATGDVTGGSWSTSGTGSFANANAASTNYTPSAADVTAGTVTLTYTSDTNGDCPVDSDDGTLTIYEQPVVNVGDFSTCENAAVAVTATGDVTGGSWSTSGTGSFANANAASTNYTPSAADVTAGTVTLTFTSAANGDCPPDSDDGTLTIYDQPAVNVGNFSTCERAPVAVTATGDVTGGSWSTSGTGSFANANAASTNYTPSAADVAAGTVTVTFTSAANGDCPADSDDGTITIYDEPTVDAGGPYSTCEDACVAIAATLGGGATGGTWTTGGDGSFDDDSEASTNYCPGSADVTAGTVKLYFTTNANGDCPAAVDSAVVTIYDEPTVDAGGPYTTCEGTCVEVSATLGGGATEGTWTTAGDGTFDDDSAETTDYCPGANDDAAGSVKIYFTTNANGDCPAAVDSAMVNIDPNPTCTLKSTPASVCVGDPATTIMVDSVSPVGGTVTYAWSVTSNPATGVCSIMDGGGPTDDYIKIDWIGAGTCTVRVVPTRNGCPGDPCEAIILVETCGNVFCTLTQGFYGNPGGTKCSFFPGGTPGSSTTEVLNALLPVTVGKGARTMTINDAECVLILLPGGGPDRDLPAFGNAVVSKYGDNYCDVNNKGANSLWDDGQIRAKSGRMANTLLAQTITLALNVKWDNGLGGWPLSKTFLTKEVNFGALPCDKSDDYVEGEICEPFPQQWGINDAVWDTLVSQYGAPTVDDLLHLANCALAGENTGVPLGSITDALGNINDGFDECREQVRCDLADLVQRERNFTSLDREPGFSGIPVKFGLSPNFPNPAQASTNIRFALPEQSKVKLTVFNIQGQVVEVLADEVMSAGFKEVRMDAQNKASGIYLYRIEAQGLETGKGFTQTMKMLLMR